MKWAFMAFALPLSAMSAEWSSLWPIPETENNTWSNGVALELQSAISNRYSAITFANRWTLIDPEVDEDEDGLPDGYYEWRSVPWDGGYTNGSYLLRGHLEYWTHTLESVFPYFSLAKYSAIGDSYLFDPWLETHDEFPATTKLDLLYTLNMGIIVSQQVGNLCDYVETATNGTPLWTKRKNRLAVGRVAEYVLNSSHPEWRWTPRTSANQLMPDAGTAWAIAPSISSKDCPVLFWVAGGTNQYDGTLSFNDTVFYCATNSTEVVAHADLTVAMTGAITRMPLPVVAVAQSGAGITGTAPNENDKIVLYWDRPISTYEGGRTWDEVPLPEQFNEHQSAASSLFLMPTENWVWTDGRQRSSYWSSNYVEYSETNGTLCETDFNAFDELGETFADDAYPAANFAWWKSCSSELDCMTVPELALSGAWVLITNGGMRPTWGYSIDANPSVSQNATAIHDYCIPSAECAGTGWVVSASRVVAGGYTASMDATKAKARVYCWPGARHRAHFYTRVSGKPYKRVQVSDWTYSSEIVSGEISCEDSADSRCVALDWTSCGGEKKHNASCCDQYEAHLTGVVCKIEIQECNLSSYTQVVETTSALPWWDQNCNDDSLTMTTHTETVVFSFDASDWTTSGVYTQQVLVRSYLCDPRPPTFSYETVTNSWCSNGESYAETNDIVLDTRTCNGETRYFIRREVSRFVYPADKGAQRTVSATFLDPGPPIVSAANEIDWWNSFGATSNAGDRVSVDLKVLIEWDF